MISEVSIEMSVNQRTQDILLGAIFGVILGIVGNMWTDVFYHLYLENASDVSLWSWLIILTIGLVIIGVYLLSYVRRLEQ